MRGREREIAEIGDRLLSSEPNSVRSRIKKLPEDALARMGDLREVLNGDTATVRAWLAKHVQRILMESGGGVYVASGKWNLLGVGHVEHAEGRNCTACLSVPFQVPIAA